MHGLMDMQKWQNKDMAHVFCTEERSITKTKMFGILQI